MQNAFHDRMAGALLWRYPRVRGNTYRTFSVRPFCRQVDDVILRVSLLQRYVLDSISLLFIMSMEEDHAENRSSCLRLPWYGRRLLNVVILDLHLGFQGALLQSLQQVILLQSRHN